FHVFARETNWKLSFIEWEGREFVNHGCRADQGIVMMNEKSVCVTGVAGVVEGLHFRAERVPGVHNVERGNSQGAVDLRRPLRFPQRLPAKKVRVMTGFDTGRNSVRADRGDVRRWAALVKLI